jgi:hypothetical protein
MSTTTTHNEIFCLACGGPVASSLAYSGSPRCHDCRDVDAPISIDLYARFKRELELRTPAAAA